MSQFLRDFLPTLLYYHINFIIFEIQVGSEGNATNVKRTRLLLKQNLPRKIKIKFQKCIAHLLKIVPTLVKFSTMVTKASSLSLIQSLLILMALLMTSLSYYGLAGWFGSYRSQTVFQRERERERERERRHHRREKKVQTTTTRTFCKHRRPLPYRKHLKLRSTTARFRLIRVMISTCYMCFQVDLCVLTAAM